MDIFHNCRICLTKSSQYIDIIDKSLVDEIEILLSFKVCLSFKNQKLTHKISFSLEKKSKNL